MQTGLANRSQFVGWLESAVGSRGPATLALVVFDLDGFRVVNDAYGHEVGNRILTAVAGHLRSVFDEVGKLARIGPDEFAVLIHDPADVATVVSLAESAVEQLAEPVWVEDDGIGFHPAEAGSGERRDGDPAYGLVGMRERAELVGATLQVISAAGTGTRVEVELPAPSSRRSSPTAHADMPVRTETSSSPSPCGRGGRCRASLRRTAFTNPRSRSDTSATDSDTAA